MVHLVLSTSDNNFPLFTSFEPPNLYIQTNLGIAIQFGTQDTHFQRCALHRTSAPQLPRSTLAGQQSEVLPTNTLTSDDELLSHRSSTNYDINACPRTATGQPLHASLRSFHEIKPSSSSSNTMSWKITKSACSFRSSSSPSPPACRSGGTAYVRGQSHKNGDAPTDGAEEGFVAAGGDLFIPC